MESVKRILKCVLKVLIVIFALVGLYRGYMYLQYSSAKSSAEKIESTRAYDKDLKYNKDGGEPIFWVKPGNRYTLFFMEGFRTQNPAGMYMPFLKYLFEKENINIVVPVYGLQSSPFTLRNRAGWHYEEDMRTILQVYDAYTANLALGHRLVVVSQSFGTLGNVVICAKARRAPDEVIFMSPLNSGLDYRASGPVVHWLSKQTSWIRYVVSFTKTVAAPGRYSVWDIVNEKKNRAIAANNWLNPEDSSDGAYTVEKTSAYMEGDLMPLIRNKKITVVWGDSDLYFNQNGFTHFAAILRRAGNTVSEMPIKNSGHMVLLDNGQDMLEKYIISVIKK